MIRSFVALAAMLGVALLLASNGTRAAAASDDGAAAALLAKHRAFVGWTFGDGTVTGWRITGTRSVAASKTGTESTDPPIRTTWSEVRRGVLYRDTFTDDGNGLQRDQGFTGRTFWDADENGNTVVHFEDEVREDVSENLIMSDAISTLPATLRSRTKIGDEDMDVVRIEPKLGFPVDLYVDARGAYRRAVVDPESDEHGFILNIDSYLEAAPGKRVIGSYHYGSGKPFEAAKAELNVAVADADLLPPAPRTHWSFGSGEPVSIEIASHSAPYGAGAGRAVQVQAAIDGHAGTFLLDSGAADTLLFGAFADSLDEKPLGHVAFHGVNGGTVGAGLIRIKTLTIGDSTLHDPIVVKSGGKGPGGVDGILGFDVLAQAIVDVDLTGQKLTIYDPAKFAPAVAKGAVAFPVDLSSRQPRIHISIGSGVDAKPIFDTGDDYLVLISDALRKIGKVVPLSAQVTLGGGVSFDQTISFSGVDGTGESSWPCARLNLIAVGPYRFENSLTCFADPAVFGANGGLVGFDFLQHFNWTFDYPDGKLVLTPNGMK